MMSSHARRLSQRLGRLGLAVALFATPLVTSASALAQKPISSAQRQEAKRLFNQGWLAYTEGEYEEAILKFQASHDISGEPLIFDAISNAYAQLGDIERARDYLAKYRAAAPEKEHAALDERLKAFDQKIAEAKRVAEESKRADDARKEKEASATRERELAAARQAVDSYDARTEQTTAGYALVGVGAAGVVTGVIVDVVAAVTRPDAETACGDVGADVLCRSLARDDIDTSNTLAIAGDVTWIVGAVTASVGVVLLVTAGGDESEEEPAPSVGLALSPSTSGPTLFAVGRF